MNGELNKIPSCHPDQTHYAFNLCRKCYGKEWRKKNPGYSQKSYGRTREKQLAQGRARYQKNREKVAQYWKEFRKKFPEKGRDWQLRRDYGITLKDYNEMLRLQNNSCKLCEVSPIKKPAVDHNHTTGKVRGIVCQGCNIVIGFFESRPQAVDNVKQYLMETNEQ